MKCTQYIKLLFASIWMRNSVLWWNNSDGIKPVKFCSNHSQAFSNSWKVVVVVVVVVPNKIYRWKCENSADKQQNWYLNARTCHIEISFINIWKLKSKVIAAKIGKHTRTLHSWASEPFSALMMSVGWQEGHPTDKSRTTNSSEAFTSSQ